MRCELVEQVRNFTGQARAHDDVVDAGKHGPVCRRWSRHLDLFQIVDSHRAVMAFLGEPHLDKVSEHGQLLGLRRLLDGELVHRGVRGTLLAASGQVVLGDRAVGDRWHGERGQGPTHVAARVSVLKPACEHHVQADA